jgi:hypothetical protein
MAGEIHRDRYGVIRHDEEAGILELEWAADTSEMNDEDFKDYLSRYAEAETSIRAPHLVIDVRRFAFRPAKEVGAWRDEQIIPRYDAAGVKKFAFLVPDGTPGTVEAGNPPAPEPPGTFPTGYFETRERIEAWFAQ